MNRRQRRAARFRRELVEFGISLESPVRLAEKEVQDALSKLSDAIAKLLVAKVSTGNEGTATETQNDGRGIVTTAVDCCEALAGCKAKCSELGVSVHRSEAVIEPQIANNAKGLGFNSTPKPVESDQLSKNVEWYKLHLKGDPDADSVILAAIEFIGDGDGSTLYGTPQRHSDCLLLRRAFVNRWDTKPDKLRTNVCDLLATLRGESVRSATAALSALRAGVAAGLIPEASPATQSGPRAGLLAAASGVPSR